MNTKKPNAGAVGNERAAALADALALLPPIMTETFKRDDMSDVFVNGVAYGTAQYCSAFKTLADPSRRNVFAEHRWEGAPAVAAIQGDGDSAISIELIDALADQYLRGNSSDYAKCAFARTIEQMALANAGALPRLDEAAATAPDLQALQAAYEASAAALAAQEALGKAKVAEVVSVLLWLYRRLPRG